MNTFTRYYTSSEIVYSHRVNVTVQLDSDQVRGFLFPAQAQLYWPSLTRRACVRFPLTQIGNISVGFLVHTAAVTSTTMASLHNVTSFKETVIKCLLSSNRTLHLTCLALKWYNTKNSIVWTQLSYTAIILLLVLLSLINISYKTCSLINQWLCNLDTVCLSG